MHRISEGIFYTANLKKSDKVLATTELSLQQLLNGPINWTDKTRSTFYFYDKIARAYITRSRNLHVINSFHGVTDRSGNFNYELSGLSSRLHCPAVDRAAAILHGSRCSIVDGSFARSLPTLSVSPCLVSVIHALRWRRNALNAHQTLFQPAPDDVTGCKACFTGNVANFSSRYETTRRDASRRLFSPPLLPLLFARDQFLRAPHCSCTRDLQRVAFCRRFAGNLFQLVGLNFRENMRIVGRWVLRLADARFTLHRIEKVYGR